MDNQRVKTEWKDRKKGREDIKGEWETGRTIAKKWQEIKIRGTKGGGNEKREQGDLGSGEEHLREANKEKRKHLVNWNRWKELVEGLKEQFTQKKNWVTIHCLTCQWKLPLSRQVNRWNSQRYLCPHGSAPTRWHHHHHHLWADSAQRLQSQIITVQDEESAAKSF